MSKCPGAHPPFDLGDCTCICVDSFALNHGLYVGKPDVDPRSVTHLDMSGHMGGKYCVPPGTALEARFMQMYCMTLAAQQFMYLVEYRTEAFPMFVDMDVRTNLESPDLDWSTYAATMQRDIKRFFPGVSESDMTERFMMLATCTQVAAMESKTSDCGAKVYKTGLHIHFPNLLVGVHEAKLLRESAVAALQIDFPTIPGQAIELSGGWNGILDDCVYGANGLRMIGACKCVTCPSCHGNRKKPCAQCQNSRKSLVKRWYQVEFGVDGLGNHMPELDPPAHQNWVLDSQYVKRVVQLTSIRRHGAVADVEFRRYTGCPAYISQALKVKKDSGLKRKAGAHSQDAEGAKKLGLTDKRRVEMTERQRLTILNVIRRLGPVEYKEIQIKDIVSMGAATTMCVRVEGVGCNWCGNVSRTHNQNSVYFVVSPNGIQQRCFSTTDRETGSCRGYKSNLACFEGTESVRIFGAVVGRPYIVAESGAPAPSWIKASADLTEQLIRNATILAPGKVRTENKRQRSVLSKWASRQ